MVLNWKYLAKTFFLLCSEVNYFQIEISFQQIMSLFQYIVGEFQNLKWSTELDSFYDETPNKGTLQFTNIIATQNPEAIRFLVLACHYDSKIFDFRFIAATDSAVPCAMLIYLAKSLKNALSQMKSVRIIVFNNIFHNVLVILIWKYFITAVVG